MTADFKECSCSGTAHDPGCGIEPTGSGFIGISEHHDQCPKCREYWPDALRAAVKAERDAILDFVEDREMRRGSVRVDSGDFRDDVLAFLRARVEGE